MLLIGVKGYILLLDPLLTVNKTYSHVLLDEKQQGILNVDGSTPRSLVETSAFAMRNNSRKIDKTYIEEFSFEVWKV